MKFVWQPYYTTFFNFVNQNYKKTAQFSLNMYSHQKNTRKNLTTAIKNDKIISNYFSQAKEKENDQPRTQNGSCSFGYPWASLR